MNKGNYTIYLYRGETIMTECCIKKNEITKYYFYIESGYTITLINCSIDNNTKSCSGTLTGESHIYDSSNIYVTFNIYFKHI